MTTGSDRTRPFGPSHSVVATAATVLFAAVIGLFVAWPAARLLVTAFDASATSEVFGSRRTWRIIGFTLGQAALSTAVTLVAALPGAWLLGRHRFRGRALVGAIWSAPFALPAVVVGSALLAVLPESSERSLPSIVAAHVLFNVGMVARALGLAWEQSDERLEQVAATLGARPARRMALMARILAPHIASLAGLVMALCLTSFAIIQMLGGPRVQSIETEIHRQTFQNLRIDRAAILALLQLVLVSTVLVWTTRRRSGATVHGRSLQSFPKVVGTLIFCVLTFVTIVPIAVLLMRATQWGSPNNASARSFGAFRALGRVTPGSGLLNAPISSLGTSIRTAALAAVIAITLAGLAVAARHSRLTTWMSSLPLAISGVTLGLGTLIGFASAPIAWRSRWWMVPLTQALVAFPFAFRVLRPAVEAIDPQLRAVAATLGAKPSVVTRRVVFPLVRGPLLAGSAIAGAVALGEFAATSFLVRARSETVPVAIGMLNARPGDRLHAQAAALCVILACMTMMLTAVGSLLGQRR
jgi:thiamine transport system permease protein